MIQLPTNHQWNQPNTSDVLGSIFASKGIDLTDNLGKIRLGKRLVLNTSSVDSVAINACPVAFQQYAQTGSTSSIWAICGNNVVTNSLDYPSGSPFGIATGSTSVYSSDVSDLIVFQNNLYATAQGALEKLTYNSTWSQVDTSLSATSAHLMTGFNGVRLYITDNNSLVVSWDGSTMTRSGTYSLDLSTASPTGSSTNSVITGLKNSNNTIWISTINTSGGKGYIYQWDGTGTTPNKQYRLDSAGAVAMVIKDDVPWVIDVYGRLLMWQGGTFVEKARLNRRFNKLFYNSLSSVNNRWIHPNGMSIINNRINILIDARHYDSTSSVEVTIPSGIWEYDENIGLYHKHSFGLSHATDTINDYGAARISRAGALTELNYPDNSASRNGTFLAGADYYTDSTTVVHGIFYDDSNDTLQKGGYFITTKIEATDGSVYNLPVVESNWQSFIPIYKNLLNATDKIIPKYKISDLDPVEALINWQDATHFTVLNSAVNISNYWTNGTGGEVDILQGAGAGMCSHITNAVLSSGTWTVTVDERYESATGTAQARFQKWIKISEIVPDNQNFNTDIIGIPSTWIQFKVFMLFTGRDEIERILISNNTATPVK